MGLLCAYGGGSCYSSPADSCAITFRNPAHNGDASVALYFADQESVTERISIANLRKRLLPTPPRLWPAMAHMPEVSLSFDPIDVLQCPRCAGILSRRADALICMGCGGTVPCRDGIIDFVQDSARSKLDDIDYDRMYDVSEHRSRTNVQDLMNKAGPWWPQSLNRVLEIGAGTGGATMGIASVCSFRHLVVTDISSKMLGLCQRNLRAANLLRPQDMTFVTYSATQKCFRPASFDTAIGSAVLHHITDVGAFLADLARSLTPTGVAFFIEPSLEFHRALAATLADIVAGLIHDGVPYNDPGVIEMCNWIAETRCNLLHQGDLEFLATREDKHMFDRNEIEALAQSSGFAQACALPNGPDPSGEQTLRVYLGQCGVDAPMIERACAALSEHWPNHTALLDTEYMSPSYILYFAKAEAPHAIRPPLGKPDTVPDRLSAFESNPVVRSYLTVQSEQNGSQGTVIVEGWLYSRTDLRWLVVDAGTTTQKFPIWLPRPDVQAIKNIGCEMPPLNVLCSGVAGRITIDQPGGPLDIDLSVVTVDGVDVSLGRITLTSQDTKASISR